MALGPVDSSIQEAIIKQEEALEGDKPKPKRRGRKAAVASSPPAVAVVPEEVEAAGEPPPAKGKRRAKKETGFVEALATVKEEAPEATLPKRRASRKTAVKAEEEVPEAIVPKRRASRKTATKGALEDGEDLLAVKVEGDAEAGKVEPKRRQRKKKEAEVKEEGDAEAGEAEPKKRRRKKGEVDPNAFREYLSHFQMQHPCIFLPASREQLWE